MRIEEADVHALHVPEDVPAQVEHDLLARPLHQVRLHKLKQISRDLENQVDQCEPRDAMHWIGRQMAQEKGGWTSLMPQQSRRICAYVARGKVPVDANHYQIWTGDSAE